LHSYSVSPGFRSLKCKAYLLKLINWPSFKTSTLCIWSAQWANNLLQIPKLSLYICFICRVYGHFDSITGISLLCGWVWDLICNPQFLSTWTGHQPRNTTTPEYWNRYNSWKMQRADNIWCNTEHVLPGQSSEWWVIWWFIVLCIRKKWVVFPSAHNIVFQLKCSNDGKFWLLENSLKLALKMSSFQDDLLLSLADVTLTFVIY